jgi:hypothetical protein
VLERPAVDRWESLIPVGDELLAGFSPPMVRTGDRVCIGFARVDFGREDLPSSLARYERQHADKMKLNEIRSLASVKSGFNTWHFIEASNHIDSITVFLVTGEAVDHNRIHLSGPTAALRLENGRELASIQWSARSQTYHRVA